MRVFPLACTRKHIYIYIYTRAHSHMPTVLQTILSVPRALTHLHTHAHTSHTLRQHWLSPFIVSLADHTLRAACIRRVPSAVLWAAEGNRSWGDSRRHAHDWVSARTQAHKQTSTHAHNHTITQAHKHKITQAHQRHDRYIHIWALRAY